MLKPSMSVRAARFLRSPWERRAHRAAAHLLYALCFLAVSALVLYKCRYGFGNTDESFYLVTPLRLARGDALFKHEWHLSQMSSVLLYPLVSLYLRLAGNTDGIILAMRYVCTSVQLLTALFLYLKLRRHHWLGAAAASLSFALYTPFGIMALSYNSMGIIALAVSLVLLVCVSRFARAQYVLSGLFFSAAVLCCPYLAVLYVVYAVAAAVRLGSRRASQPPQNDLCRFIFFTIGVMIAAASFLAFVLSRASVQDILAALPHILSDPEHPSVSLIEKTLIFFRSILTITPISAPVVTGLALLLCACALDKKRRQRIGFYILPAAAGVLALLLDLGLVHDYINFVMWPVNLLAPFILLLSREKAVRPLFLGMHLPGMAYAFCLNLSSNQAFYAISSASSVATVASLVMICLFASEWLLDTPASKLRLPAALLLCALLTTQLCVQASLRYSSVFWENSMRGQSRQVSKGIYKGLLVTKSKRTLYNTSKKRYNRLVKLSPESRKVLYLSTDTWYYLIGDYEIASYSGWLSGVNDKTIERLAAYYALNPDKYPDIVYANPEYASVAEAFAQTFGYIVADTSDGVILLHPDMASAQDP